MRKAIQKIAKNRKKFQFLSWIRDLSMAYGRLEAEKNSRGAKVAGSRRSRALARMVWPRLVHVALARPCDLSVP